MKVKDLIDLLKNQDKETEVVIKNYQGSSDVWTPKQIKYVVRLDKNEMILID